MQIKALTIWIAVIKERKAVSPSSSNFPFSECGFSLLQAMALRSGWVMEKMLTVFPSSRQLKRNQMIDYQIPRELTLHSSL